MRVAVAGVGAFAKYFIDELPAAGHEVVLLTRSHKPAFDGKPGVVEQRIADYSSVQQLAEQLRDCDALVSTIFDWSTAFVDIQLALIEACKLSPKCKRFIPSEFGFNSDEFPDLPGAIFENNRAVRRALAAQSEIEWTAILLGWIMDYFVPSANRYHADFSGSFPLDWNTKTLTIPGTGNEPFAATSARDTVKAVTELLRSTNKWRPYTYVQGVETTWLQMVEVVKTIGGMPDLKVEFESVDELRQVSEQTEAGFDAEMAQFKLHALAGSVRFDQDKVQRDHDEHFAGVRFRTVADLLTAVKSDPSVIV